MATKDPSRRRENEVDAIRRAAERAALPTAVAMAALVRSWWDERKYPENEYQAALGWAGSLERLYRWFKDSKAANNECSNALEIQPLQQSIKDEIMAAAQNGDPGPLHFTRLYGIPYSVVRYVADGEPHIDTFRRPWLPRRSY
jgi:hypothetical protein